MRCEIKYIDLHKNMGVPKNSLIIAYRRKVSEFTEGKMVTVSDRLK